MHGVNIPQVAPCRAINMFNVARTSIHDRGFALVLVVWVALLLSLVAATFIYSVRSQVRISSNSIESARAESLADAGVMLAVNDILASSFGRSDNARFAADGAQQSCKIGNLGRISIIVRDEFGRVDLNRAGLPLINALLVGLGADSERASQIAAAIVDYRDRDQKRHNGGGAERDEYESSGRGFGPKNAPFESVYEVNQVVGLSQDLAVRLQPHVTLFSGAHGVDPKVMSDQSLQLIRRGAFGALAKSSNFSDVGISTQLPATFVTPSKREVFSIAVQAETATGAKFIRIAVIDLAPRHLRNYRFREWRQGDASMLSEFQNSDASGLPTC